MHGPCRHEEFLKSADVKVSPGWAALQTGVSRWRWREAEDLLGHSCPRAVRVVSSVPLGAASGSRLTAQRDRDLVPTAAGTAFSPQDLVLKGRGATNAAKTSIWGP